MRVIYIAGPYRGKDNWEIHKNIFRAEELALEVWRLGAVALCPHLNTAHFQNACPDDVWLKGDIELLRRCDAVLVTPTWPSSEGAREEVKFARANNIPVLLDLEDLVEFLMIKPPPATATAVAA